jgi:hypothetical protein
VDFGWDVVGVGGGFGYGFLGERLVSLIFLITKEDRDCLRVHLLLKKLLWGAVVE